MTLSHERRFEFDVQGFVHLRGALAPPEMTAYLQWARAAEGADTGSLAGDHQDRLINRPVSRIIDVDPRFACFLDHPAVAPYLIDFLGPGYKHIDNELYYSYPGYEGGPWHRGIRTHPTGHVVDGRFVCPMVKVFYCLTGVGPGEGEFAVVPGSHRARFDVDGGPADQGDDPLHRTAPGRIDLPAQKIFDDVGAGDVIMFNEALLHTGRPNPSPKTRKTVIVNFGREDAGPWPGYRPLPETLRAVTPRQAAILTGGAPVWAELPVGAPPTASRG